MSPLIAAALVSMSLCGQVAVELQRLPDAAATSGSQLVLTALREIHPDMAGIEFDTGQAVVLANTEVLYALMIFPAVGAAEAVDAALAGKPTPPRGAPIGLINFMNLLPEDIPRSDDLYGFLWKNDTVRKLGAALVTVRREANGEFHLLFWGPGERPLSDLLVPAAPRSSERFLEVDYVKNDLEFRFFGSYVFSKRLRAFIFNY